MNQEKTSKHKMWKWLVVIGVIIIAVGLGIWSIRSYATNYAEETAKPIEQALVEAGAVKVCSRGDNGRGSDNREPNYSAVFETTMRRDQAIQTVRQASSDSGY